MNRKNLRETIDFLIKKDTQEITLGWREMLI